MTEKAKPRGKIRLVFAGVRQGANKKLSQIFYKLNNNGEREKDLRAYSKVKGLGRPGAIYDVECDAEDDGTIYTNTLSYAQQWDNTEQVVEWQARHDATIAADRARRRHNREAKRNLIEERLRPLREAYQQCYGLERAALVAQIVGYVTGRLPEER